MKTNTHGLKMIGLRKACGETQDYGTYSPSYDQIFYDRATGEIWTVYHYSLGMNSWTEYHDNDVIHICNAQHHMTMQEIADMIAQRVQELDSCLA